MSLAEDYDDPLHVETIFQSDLSYGQLQAEWDDKIAQKYRLQDFEVYDTLDEGRRYSFRWQKDDGRPWVFLRDQTLSQLWEYWDTYTAAGYRITDLEVYEIDGTTRYATIYAHNDEQLSWYMYRDLDKDGFDWLNYVLTAVGYRVVDFEGYTIGGQSRYAAIWLESSDAAPNALVYDVDSIAFGAWNALLSGAGYELAELESYTQGGLPRYGAVWRLRQDGRRSHEQWMLGKADFEALAADATWRGDRVANFSYEPTLGYSIVLEQNTGPEIRQELYDAIQELSGEVTFYLEDLQTGAVLAFNEDEPRYLASVGKVAVMGELFRRVDEGLSLTDTVVFDEQYYYTDSNELNVWHIGQSFSYEDLVGYLIGPSDNTAHEILVGALGAQAINGFMESIGYGDVNQTAPYSEIFRLVYSQFDGRFAREPSQNIMSYVNNKPYFPLSFVPTLNGDVAAAFRAFRTEPTLNVGTARSLAGFMGDIVGGAHWSPSSAAEMRSLLPQRSCRGLPSGWTCRNKNGIWDDVRTRAGYMKDPSGTPRVAFAIFGRKSVLAEAGTDQTNIETAIGEAAYELFGLGQ